MTQDIPLHIMVDLILPKAYDELSIDTRRAMGLAPRKLQLSAEWLMPLKEYVDLRVRCDDGLVIMQNKRLNFDRGTVDGHKYNGTVLELHISKEGYRWFKSWEYQTKKTVAYRSTMHTMTGKLVYDSFIVEFPKELPSVRFDPNIHTGILTEKKQKARRARGTPFLENKCSDASKKQEKNDV